MKLYYLETSPPCRAVKMVLHTLNVPVEIIEMSVQQGDHVKPEFLKVNPAHTIPALDDNGFIVSESHAICSYLVSKYGDNDALYPKDLQKRAKVDEQLHYNNEVFSIFKFITVPILYKKNKNFSDENRSKILDVLNVMEQILEKQDYFAGDQLTIADFSHVSLVPALNAYVPIEADKYPRLVAWMSRCSKNIKGYKEVNAKGSDQLEAAILAVLNGP